MIAQYATYVVRFGLAKKFASPISLGFEAASAAIVQVLGYLLRRASMHLLGYLSQLILGTSLLPGRYLPLSARGKNLIVDTDLFSDVEYATLFKPRGNTHAFPALTLLGSDAGALLLASTAPSVKLLAVNVNYPSSYSVLAASAILNHYGHADVPIGARRPLTNATFFDSWSYNLGEFASKVAYHYSGGSLPWGRADDAWDPVRLYRKCLAEAPDGSVTIASIGFFENVSPSIGLGWGNAHTYSQVAEPA